VIDSNQERCQQGYRRQSDRSVGELLEKDGKSPGGVCGLDAAVGGVLGEVQHLGEQGSMRLEIRSGAAFAYRR
jgi:hypothetical protein